ncbi:nuclear transport factor 2 family protein [Rhodococcus artemisiae]|uniref:Nuclear transport factor 2 family protein n=1 Tax=Rhodococcus artemisiae TaxID=714159 RepID=A0ABU7L928_9NOCA|nr:nuclear transport factor 2 family protein [Rhodococcus artemisiae]MEE2058053.1 nuclear transport factor 2 family protein [Rhodococcus artemisiae]
MIILATMQQSDVLEVENARLMAMTEGDLDTLDVLIADSALYIHSSGEIDTKHEYLRKLATGRFRYAAVTAENQHTTDLGAAAALTYRMRARVIFPAGPHLIHAQVTAIWRRYDDGIRLELLQSTPIPAEA